ncbi:MAG: hypothetical protein ICV83_18400 [Cytophagales bacterium]|nr:hypothetical protein [Cytophagales bacterium]
MKTKKIFALLMTLLLSVFSIQAAGLVDGSDLLFGPAKGCAPRKAARQPIAQKTGKPEKAAGEVLVKLFNADGELVCLQSVTMAEFVSGDFARNCLPAGTTFVMFHDHIAYYQTNTDGAATPGA